MTIYRCLICVSVALLATFGVWFTESTRAETPRLLQVFARKSVEARPDKNYQLTKEEGPWLIFAGTFAGPQAMEQAKALTLELRRDYDLPAFIYSESFDFTGEVEDLKTGNRVVRYANPTSYDTCSVLVGEFDSVDHPYVERTLKTIKAARPKAFNLEGQDNSPLAAVRKMSRQLMGEEKQKQRGPLANAFVTRNPLLPDEFFQQPQVDSFVMSINQNVEHSLLDNPGKFTVVVRTFEAISTIVDGKRDKDFKPSAERLNSFAYDANRMVKALRAKGVEAYEFHDRYRSMVAVGSFDNLGVRTADGGFQYDPEIVEVIEKYRAGDAMVRTSGGVIALEANHVLGIPFDVNPRPIAVPRKSKRSLYTATMDAIGRG